MEQLERVVLVSLKMSRGRIGAHYLDDDDDPPFHFSNSGSVCDHVCMRIAFVHFVLKCEIGLIL